MINRQIEMKILRVVPSQDKILVDAEQRFSPWWWPSALLSPLGWQHHVIMTTVEHPAGCANLPLMRLPGSNTDGRHCLPFIYSRARREQRQTRNSFADILCLTPPTESTQSVL